MKKDRVTRRKERIRREIAKTNAGGRPRLTVHRTNQHICAQIIDDVARVTLVSASSNDRDLRGDLSNGGNKAAAAAVGKRLATLAVQKGVETVVFDRSGYLYHGRVKSLAEAARESGLKF